MKIFLRKFCLLLVISLVLISFSNFKTYAAQLDFKHVIKANYIVQKDRSATVTYNIKTTNNLNNNYLTTFSLSLPFEPLEISTANSQTAVKVKALKKVSDVNLYELDIDFTNPIFGKGKAFEWSFSFKIKDLLIDHGMQEAIFLPTFANDTNISSYNLSLTIPKSFGEVRNIYGKGLIKESGKNYQILFSATQNQTSNVIVLIGLDQQYQFNLSSEEDLDSSISLPENNSYQEVIYQENPSKEYNLDNINTKNQIILKKGDKVSAIINTKFGSDKSNIGGKIYSSDKSFIKERFKKVNLENLSIKEKAEKIYQDSLLAFTVDNYNVSENLVTKFDEDKISVNIEELNLIYKYLLGEAGIETRGVYGYVFPIQPFQREIYFVEQHIWTEFWDGQEWISVDPAWYLSSKGNKYFDNNQFHHIKFGNYHDISELKSFFNSKRFISITPLKEKNNIEKTGDLEVTSDDTVYLNKELQISIKNRFNYPITITNITSDTDQTDITAIKPELKSTFILMPGDNVNLNLKYDYQFILLNRVIKSDINIEYSDGSDSNKIILKKLNPTVQSNISNYISYIIFGLFVLIALLSLIGLSLYKIKKE